MKNFKNFSTLISILFLIIGAYYIYNNPELFEYFDLIELKILVWLIGIKFITLLINAFFNKDLLRCFEVDLSFPESLYIASITFVGNLLLPGRLGGSLRLVYLKKVYGLKSTYLLNIFAYFFIVSIFINSFFGILSLLLITQIYDFNYITWILVFLFSFSISSYLLFSKFRIKKKTTKNKFLQIFYNFLKTGKEGWLKILEFKNLNRRLISIYILNYFFFFLEIAIIFEMFNFTKDTLNIVFYNSVSVFSNLIGLTPGALGIKESLMIFSLDIISVDLNRLFVIAIVERIVAILFMTLPLIYTVIYSKKK